MKHAEGPWRAEDGIDNMLKEGRPGRYNIRAADGFNVARVWEDGMGKREEAAANARLIASSPTLLEACKEVSKYWEVCKVKVPGGLANQVRQAILQAEGGGE